MILWALSREIRLLYQCAIDIGKGQNQQRVLQSQRVWDKRKPIVSAGLARHTRDDLGELLHRASLVDHSIKGLANGQPWDRLSGLVLELSTGQA